MSPDEIRVARRQYCAAIELIDDYVGRILDALAARGMLENTFIIFSSDHGEMLGDHGLFTKHTAYEPAWRVPLIVAGPGVSRGINSDALIELIDLNPTICELAGLPAQDGIDAHSFAPLLRGEATTHRADLMTSEEGYHALRTERYKYIETIHDRAELYDLADDPEERHNLIEEAPAIAAELSGRLRARYVEGKWMRG